MVHIAGADDLGHDGDLPVPSGSGHQGRNGVLRVLREQALHLRLEALHPGLEPVEGSEYLPLGRAQSRRRAGHDPVPFAIIGDCGPSRDRFYPTDVRSYAPLRKDLEDPYLAGRAHVGAPTQLAAEVVDLDDPDEVLVLLAEEGHSTQVARMVKTRRESAHGVVLYDPPVDQLLDLGEPFRTQRLMVGEVEPELVGAYR